MLFDVHAHIQFNAYKDDADAVIQRAIDEDIYLIAPSSQKTTSERAVEYAQMYPGRVFAAVGLHPLHLKRKFVDPMEDEPGPRPADAGRGSPPKGAATFQTRGERFDHDFYRRLAEHEQTVAIGETGFDYHPRLEATGEDRNKQEETFRQQIELALNVGKPIITHLRSGKVDGKKTSSHKDAIRVIGDYVPRGLRGLIHCYSGNETQAKVYMDMGFFLSFTGLITYQPQWDDLLKTMPIESILTETDAPYLTPEPERSEGKKTPEGFVRNEPTGVKRVAEHIARLRDISFEEAAEQTTKNAIELFGITVS